MTVTEAQSEIIQAQKERVQAQLERARTEIANANIDWETARINLNGANADEYLIAKYDLGYQAAAGAAELVDSVLGSVSAFLDGLFDG